MSAALLDNMDYGGAANADRIAAWLARAEALHDRALSKGESARLPLLQGRLAELNGAVATAAARYRRSNAIHPHPQNEAGTRPPPPRARPLTAGECLPAAGSRASASMFSPGRGRRPRPAVRRAAGLATGSRLLSRRGRSRSTCVVNGRLRHTRESAVRRAPPCVVSRV